MVNNSGLGSAAELQSELVILLAIDVATVCDYVKVAP